MDFIFDKNKLEEIQEIVSLYKKFDKYKNNTREELYYHILPSIKLKQYKTLKENNKVVAFANWAYLNDVNENQYVKTGYFDDNAWNSGNNSWVIDVVCKEKAGKMVHWLRHYFKKVKWMKLNKPSKRIGSKGY